MASTFGGLSTSLSALYAQRRGLDVTGQNIANANTEGYSRQRVEMGGLAGVTQPARHSVADSAVSGGVQVTDVARLRDEFLEARGRAERGQNAYLADQRQMYGAIETAIGEPSDTGLQSQLSEFWSGWHDLSNRPDDLSARTAVLARAGTVAAGMRSTADRLSSLYGSTREQLEGLADDVNTTAATVAQLNASIISAQAVDLPANELLDRRDKLVLHLSEQTGGTAQRRADGSVDFHLNGAQLVSGTTSRSLAVAGALTLDSQAGDPVQLRWADSGNVAAAPSGRMASALETLNTTLPRHTGSLNDVAAALAADVNTQHKAGFDLAGVAGVDLFSGTTAATLAVVVTDTTKLAASGSATARLDGSNADAVGALAKKATGADRTYRQFVVDLGVATQTINRRADIQEAVTRDVDAARISQSGVNLDEEMTNMLMFQRGYEAAAQVMKAIDETLQTLINSVGR